jgi:hypothetical protein
MWVYDLNDQRLKIFFAPHLPEAITPNFCGLFQQCQVFALEHSSFDEVDDKEVEWNDAAQGIEEYEPSPLSPFHLFSAKLAKTVFNSRKSVVLERSPITNSEADTTTSLFTKSRNYWGRAKFEDATRLLGEYLESFAAECDLRDRSYASQLRDMLGRFRDQKILAMRGALHYEILPDLLDGLDVQCENMTWIPNCVFTLLEEGTLRLLHGGKIDQDELVRIHIQADFTPVEPPYSAMLAARNKVGAMSAKDVTNYRNDLAMHPKIPSDS